MPSADTPANTNASMARGVAVCVVLGVVSLILGRAFPTVGSALWPRGGVDRHDLDRGRSSSGVRWCEKSLLEWAVAGMGFRLSLDMIQQVTDVGLLTVLVACAHRCSPRDFCCVGFRERGVSAGCWAWYRDLRLIRHCRSSCALGWQARRDRALCRGRQRSGYAGYFFAAHCKPSGRLLGGAGWRVDRWWLACGRSCRGLWFCGERFGGTLAVTIKMGRVCALLPLVLVLSVVTGSRAEKTPRPWYLLGFLITFGVSVSGVLPDPMIDGLKWLDKAALCIAMVGIGLRIHLRQILGQASRSMGFAVAVWGAQLAAVALLLWCL